MLTLKSWLATLALALFTAVPSAQAADQAGFDEGIDYDLVDPPQPTRSQDRVEVLELFWYACPHCYHFEDNLHDWMGEGGSFPEAAEFHRMPAVVADRSGRPSPGWAILARAYYTAELLDVGERIHTPLFKAIHDEERKLFSEDTLAAFFAEHGVDEEAFRKAYRSFAVNARVNRAYTMTNRYQIQGVPTLIVAGKYRIGAGQAGTRDRMIEIANHLIAKEAAALAGGTASD